MKPCDNWRCPFYTLGSKGGCEHRDDCPFYSCDEDVQIEHVEYDEEQMGREK